VAPLTLLLLILAENRVKRSNGSKRYRLSKGMGSRCMLKGKAGRGVCETIVYRACVRAYMLRRETIHEGNYSTRLELLSINI
jgi:hypothetical protein